MMHTKGHPHVELDGFYHDHHPALSHSPSLLSDPVERHGQQFWEMAIQQKERVKQQELLSKVFSSWQQRRTESSGPVSADVIANLKRTSRLLHYCSSPILLGTCSLEETEVGLSAVRFLPRLSPGQSCRGKQWLQHLSYKER